MFNKALILPLVSLLCLLVKQFTGYQFDDKTVDVITDATVSVLVIVGMFMHPKVDK